MVAANQANFFGDGDEVLPVMGGLSNFSRAQITQQENNFAAAAAASAAAKLQLQRNLDAANKAAAAKIVADQKAAADAAARRSGGVLGDLKVIGKGVASAAGTVAKVAGTVAAVVPGGQLVGAALIAGGSAATALGKGDVKGAIVAGVTAAAPAVGSAVKTIAPVVEAAKVVQDAVGTVKSVVPVAQVIAAAGVVDKLIAGVNVTAATLVPALGAGALVSDAKNLEGLRVVADKVIAASQQSGAVAAQAKQIIADTARLAASPGIAANVKASAAAAIKVMSEVGAARARAGIAAGMEQAVTAAGAKAAAAYLASTSGIPTPLPAGATVRSEVAAGSFVRTSSIVAAPTAPLVSGFAGAAVPAALASSAAAKPTAPAPAAAPKPAPAPAAAKPAPAPAAAPVIAGITGFVVTADARILDGTSWIEDVSGAAGVLVRATGPIEQRRDVAARRWKRV